MCSSCRLDKCFANGMQTELIRCPTSKKTTNKQTKKIINNQPDEEDRSYQVKIIRYLNARFLSNSFSYLH